MDESIQVDAVAAAHRRNPPRLAHWFLWLGLALVLYLALPIARIAVGSVSRLPEAALDAELRNSILLTFGAAAVAVAVGVLLSVPLGYALAREGFRGRKLIMALIDMPLVLPHPVAGIGLLLLFSRNAWSGRLLAALHIHLVGTALGISAAMLFVAVPYLVHSCRAGFMEVDVRYEQLARTLGCSSWHAFRRVALPMARRHVVSGAILMLARAVSEFGALIILAYNPRAISVLIYDRFTTYGISAALPAATVLVLFGFAVIWLVSTLEGVTP